MTTRITLIKESEMKYTSMGVEGELAEIVMAINPLSTTMGGGISRMKKTAYDWQLKYDEVIYVISGSMYIIQNGVKHETKQSDTYVIKEGAEITYGTDSEAVFFFSTYPVNWRELNKSYTKEQVSQNLVTVIKGSDIKYDPIEGAVGELSEIAMAINPVSTTLGGGFAKFKKSSYDWQIKYDEAIYVISGSMYIIEDGVKIEAKQGDIYFMKEGAKVTYGSDEETELFYTLYPVNWRQIKI